MGHLQISVAEFYISHALLQSGRINILHVAEHHNAPSVDGREPACIC